jgi:hypothetical protein
VISSTPSADVDELELSDWPQPANKEATIIVDKIADNNFFLIPFSFFS